MPDGQSIDCTRQPVTLKEVTLKEVYSFRGGSLRNAYNRERGAKLREKYQKSLCFFRSILIHKGESESGSVIVGFVVLVP